MESCLRLKAAQHPKTFGRLLASTGDQVLVEESTRDSWWGAIPVNDVELEGRNVLGLLLMEIRKESTEDGGLGHAVRQAEEDPIDRD